MKKLLSLVTTVFLMMPLVASATILFPSGGGTGSSTLSGILIGNGVSPINTLTIGSGLTLTGTTLTSSGGSSSFGTTSLSALYPLLYTTSASLARFSIAFGTTTANTWSQTQVFNGNVFLGTSTARASEKFIVANGTYASTSPVTQLNQFYGATAIDAPTGLFINNSASCRTDACASANLFVNNNGFVIDNSGPGGATNGNTIFFTAGAEVARLNSVGGLALASDGTYGLANGTTILSVGGGGVIGAAYKKLGSPTNGIAIQGSTGIGTSSPFANLSIHANNGDTNTTLFAIGSSTATATTTLFSISNTGVMAVQGTGTSTFAGGINLTGTDCVAIGGTCLQTYIQNATAYKQAVNYATAAVLPGTPTYANGSSGVGATLTEVGFGALVVDGQTVTLGQRILVKNQADQTQNGIYTVTTVGSGIASYLLTRSTDYNTSNDIYAGTTVPVLAGGTANGDTQWTESTTGTITIGSSNIAFIETSLGTSVDTFAWPFTPQSYGNSTSSVINFTVGALLTGSTTIVGSATTTNAFTVFGSTTLGTQLNGAGLTNCTGTSALTWSGGVFGCTAQPQGTVTAVTGSFPISSSGGATPNITFGGLSTSTAAVLGNIPYYSGVNTFANVATGTITGSTGLSVTAGQSVIGSGLTITNTGVTSIVAGTNVTISGATGAVTVNSTWPWTANAATVFYGQVANSTTTEMHYGGTPYSLSASSTAAFDQIVIGSTTLSTLATSTNFGNESIRGTASTTALIVSNLGAVGTPCLTVNTNGQVATQSCTTGSTGNWFTPTTNFGALANATNTPIWFQQGLQASSTVIFGAATKPQFYWDNVNGRLGIGTSTPESSLHLSPVFTPAAGATTSAFKITGYETVTSSPDTHYGLYNVLSVVGGSGTLRNFYNDYRGLIVNSGSTVTNRYAYYAASSTGAGTIINNFDFISEPGAGASGFGTTSPYAQFAIQVSPVDKIYTTLFTIASSTATATTTLFSVSNTGSITTQLGNALVLSGGAGTALTAYGGASACSTNNWVTTISGVGGTTCGTIGANGLTLSMFPTIAANTVIGNLTGATATPTAFATSSLFTGAIGNFGYFSSAGGLVGTSTIFASTKSFVGIGSTTPFSALSVGTGAASSSITVAEYKYGITGNAATSTAANIDCNASNQIAWPIGSSATTLTLTNLTPGKKCIVVVQNPGAAAGALTWAVPSGVTLKWAGGTLPTQTTTANQMDVWSFLATQGSSSMQVIGAGTMNN